MTSDHQEPSRLAVIVFAAATLVLGLAYWLGPLAYGVGLLRDGKDVAGWIITSIGAVWAVLLARDAQLPGLMFATVHTVLIRLGLAKDPWDEEPEL